MQALPASSARWLPWGLFVALLAFYGALLPTRLYGDDVWFVRCIVMDEPFSSHFLYMPLARGWTRAWALAGVDPFLALRLLAVLCAACGCALSSAAALRRGAQPTRALVFALLCALAPSTVFFATAAEIHAVHLGAFGLLAWTLARLGTDAASRRTLAVGLAFGLFVGTHQSGGLFLPGVLATYALATPGRSLRARRADAGWFTLAGLASLALMALCHRLETGRLTALGDTTGLLGAGLRQRLSELTPTDALAYLGEDAVAYAVSVFVIGAVSLGALARRRRSVALAVCVCLIPYLLFFPLFHFVERGAYFVVCLPVLAAAACTSTSSKDTPAAGSAFAVPLVVAGLLGALRPQELLQLGGALQAAGLVALAALSSIALPQAALRGSRATLALALVCALQAVGSVRELRAFARETPLLSWMQAIENTAAEASAAGEGETWIITEGFEEYYGLQLLATPWPPPYAGTWPLAPEEGPPQVRPFLYGDSTVPDEQFRGDLEQLVSSGTRVLLDRRVAEFVDKRPPSERSRIGGQLDHIRSSYRLVGANAAPFHAWRILPKP